MVNIQDFISSSNVFRKFEVDDLLFIEIVCPVEDDAPSSNLWWHNNFFSYAIAGEMMLKTLHGEYVLKAGDCIFAKKGSIISARHLVQEDFCELRVFVPDDFIRSVFQKHKIPLNSELDTNADTLIPLETDEVLEVYFHSLLTYFRQEVPPSEMLLKLKFEELVVTILSNNIHRPLRSFFSAICRSQKPSVREIMEANFFSNLSLEEFARLCARSLSAFKEEFKNTFQTTPGKWLLEKRLEYSRYLLETTGCSIDEICDVSGFENRSHFNRVFKSKYGRSPGKFAIQK
ncbi:MAG TPA: AraC family transcriptional regulator [Chryseolinea sp.]|nr:AraC family transcriptional regulator [Chryseolinea sp.]